MPAVSFTPPQNAWPNGQATPMSGLPTAGFSPWLPNQGAPVAMPYYPPILQPASPVNNAPIYTPTATAVPGRYLAQSVPISQPSYLPQLPALPAIKRPEETAPCVFSPHMMAPGANAASNPGAWPVNNSMNRFMPSPAISSPPLSVQQAQPGLSQPASAPVGNTNANAQPATVTPNATENTALLNLTPLLVTEINTDLQNPSPESRMMASQRLGRTISSNPSILTDPQTQATVEALLLKALQDPSPIVRQPLMISLMVAADPNSGQATPLTGLPKSVMNVLDQLERSQSFFNFESGDITRLKSMMAANASQVQQKQAMAAAQNVPQTAPSPSALPLSAGPQSGMPIQPVMPSSTPALSGLGQASPFAQTNPGQPVPPSFPIAPSESMANRSMPVAQPLFPNTQGMTPFYNAPVLPGATAQRLNVVSQ